MLDLETEFDTARVQESSPSTGNQQSAAGRESTCSAEVLAHLQPRLVEALEGGLACARRFDKPWWYIWISLLMVTRGVEFECERLPGACAQIDWWDGLTKGTRLSPASIPFYPPIKIYIDPITFFQEPCAGTQPSILWHELMHLLLGPHDPRDTPKLPESKIYDRVLACQTLCFNPNATKCHCASCLEARVCDSRCAGLGECNPRLGARCDCPTSPRWYSTKAACTVGCPTGGACFTFFACPEIDYSCPP
jgi:hypothetical protein